MILISVGEYNQLSWKCGNSSQKETASHPTDLTPPPHPPPYDNVDTAALELFKIHATTTKSDVELDTEIRVRPELALGEYEEAPCFKEIREKRETRQIERGNCFEHQFQRTFADIIAKKELQNNSNFLSDERYSEINTNLVRIWDCGMTPWKVDSPRHKRDLRLVRRFKLGSLPNGDRELRDAKGRKFIKNGEIFSILWNCHRELSHGGQQSMERRLKLNFANVPRDAISIFVKLRRSFGNKELAWKRKRVNP